MEPVHSDCALCGTPATLLACITCDELVCDGCLTPSGVCELCDSEDSFIPGG